MIYLLNHAYVMKPPLKPKIGSSHCGAAETNPTSIHEDEGSIPGLAQWVRDLALLWLWYHPAAVVPALPLAWELSFAGGVVLKKQETDPPKNPKGGVPAMAQQDLQHLCSARMQVRSLSQHSGLKDLVLL